MKQVKNIKLAEYILSALPLKERMEVVLRIANEVFKKSSLKPKDIEEVVKEVRKKIYEEQRKKNKSSN